MTNLHPYHITSRCNNKEFFPLPLDRVWSIMMKHLKSCQEEMSLRIHAFVLMGNHFHLLCHTPLSNIDDCMHAFLSRVAIEINRQANVDKYLWGEHYRWSVIDSRRHYYHVYRYIYQNPIRADLSLRVEDYPWSTLNKDLPFPLHSNIPMTFCGEEGERIWLNEKYGKEDLELIKGGLKKQLFDLDQRNFKAFNKLSVPR